MISADSKDILGIVSSIGVALAISIVIYRRTSPSIPKNYRNLLAVLRFIGVCGMMLLITSPVLRLVKRESGRPLVVFLVDTSKSMAYPDSSECAIRFKLLLDSVSQVGRMSDIKIFRFSSEAQEISKAELTSLRPNGLRTDIAGALGMIKRLDSKPSSIVLLSDGANNFGDDPVYAASLLRIPIHSLIATPKEQTQDIAIQRISEIGTCYAGTNVSFWIEVCGRCDTDLTSHLRIIDSTGVVFSSQVVVPGGGATSRIPVSIGCGDVGLHRFRAELSPFEGEKVTTNNSLEFALKVIKGKIGVLVIASKPSWDFAFTVRALKENPAFEVSTYFVDPQMRKLSSHPQQGVERRFATSDLVIAFGNSLASLSSEILNNYLERGGSIILVPGLDGLESPYSPFRTDRRSQGTNQARVYPTDAGSQHEVLKIGTTGGFGWEKLPPIAIPTTITGCREGSLVLLEARTDKETLPVLVVNRFDEGKVIALGGIDFWRWDLLPTGFGLDVRVFSQIVTNLVNWLSEQTEISMISVMTSKHVYLLGEPITVVARIVDEDIKPLSGLEVTAVITNRSSPQDSYSIDLDDLGNGNYKLRLDPTKPGRYLIDVRAQYQGKILTGNAEFDVDTRGLEDSNLNGDRGLLERISSVSGGRVYTLEEAGDLIENLEMGSPVREVTRILRFDLKVLTFLLLVGVFGIEWLLRRRKMLV